MLVFLLWVTVVTQDAEWGNGRMHAAWCSRFVFAGHGGPLYAVVPLVGYVGWTWRPQERGYACMHPAGLFESRPTG